MALGKKNSCDLKSRSMVAAANSDGTELGLAFVNYTTGIGGKRLSISREMDNFFGLVRNDCVSRLESLPQDMLIRIICGVHHEDLKHLLHVSRTIENATMIAEELHFAYSTPKKTQVFRNGIDFEEPVDDTEVAPNAPKRRKRRRFPINRKNICSLSVSLFA